MLPAALGAPRTARVVIISALAVLGCTNQNGVTSLRV
jgi:hypothetical protein